MNFKIEINFLNITNYPSIERHFEDMSSKGWLINKIISGSLFIYKKIEPEDLDFSITPYEIETAFTRKSKEELEEFNSVCKLVGWNYATKSLDLHVYFKERDSETLEIQTDEEEEFKTLELIGKKHIRSYSLQIPLLIFLSWLLLGGISNNIYSMKNGLVQIVVPLVPMGIIFNIWALIHTRKFIKKNRKNMEIGKAIEYSESGYYIPKLYFFILLIILFALLIYILYVSVVLKNKIVLAGLFPAFIGLIVGTAYRFNVKPLKKSLIYKIIGFVLAIIVAAFLSIWLGIFNISTPRAERDNSHIEGYKVLSIEDFPNDRLEESGSLNQQISFLIPESYEYYFYSEEGGPVVTEYSNVLTENLASNLVGRYIRQSKNAFTGRYGRLIELYLEEGIYDDYLLTGGLGEKELSELKNKDIKDGEKAAREIINDKSIVEDRENLWNTDEAYFLNYEGTEIVLRNGKEVFYLEGKDFSNMEIINIVKEKLDL